MTIIDLFGGIGGFSLALDMVWNEKENKHIFVEYNPFCQAILRKNWPKAEIHGDIHAFVADARSKHGDAGKDEKKGKQGTESTFSFSGRRNKSSTHSESFIKQQLAMEREPDEKESKFTRPDIITGGFPCQPFSHAGRRKGTADDRYLWPAMRDTIAIFKPRWVIAENVAGLASWNDGMVLETVCSDLEKEGYEVQPFIIPASAVGAPHRRDRVWIIAHSGPQLPRRSERRGNEKGSSDKLGGSIKTYASNSKSQGLENGGRKQKISRSGNNSAWNEEWPQAAARLCSVDDGISRELAGFSRGVKGGYRVIPGGDKGWELITKSKWKKEALKGGGNAIVPWVAVQIMKAIKDSE